MVQLGVLDYAQIDEGENATTALHHTVLLAKHAEALGYTRFWMAEHHNVPAFASSSPEMVMMHLANATKRIRLGSGGVMLPHYSPYKVAENFRILEAFFPNRIDLGIGNNIGTPLVKNALNENKNSILDYEKSMKDIQTYLTDQVNEEHRFHGITANPVVPTNPEMWLLSTSMKNAKVAAKLGLGYMFGLFLLADEKKLANARKAIDLYQSEFNPSPFMKKPNVSIAPIIVVADTNEQARAYAETLDLWLLGKGHFTELRTYPSIDAARNYPYTEYDKQLIQTNRNRMIVGDIDRVKTELDTLIKRYKADEVLFIPLIPGIEARKRALELLADAFL